MTIRMSSHHDTATTMLGTSRSVGAASTAVAANGLSLDSSSSYVEIDSDNATSRSSSLHDDADGDGAGGGGGVSSPRTAHEHDRSVATTAAATIVADDDDDDEDEDTVHHQQQQLEDQKQQHSGHHDRDRDADDDDDDDGADSDTVDTKPTVHDFQQALHSSEHFLRSNFAAVSMANSLSMQPHHHHHHASHLHHSTPHHPSHPHHHHHHHHRGLTAAAAAAAFHSAGYAAVGDANGAGRLTPSPPAAAAALSGQRAKPAAGPFMSPAQLYKSLFASAVLQNPEKMQAAGFPRNLLFSCATQERSTDSAESADGDDKDAMSSPGTDEVVRGCEGRVGKGLAGRC